MKEPKPDLTRTPTENIRGDVQSPRLEKPAERPKPTPKPPKPPKKK